MTERLDNRRSLFGETRLTDNQVIALRAAWNNDLRFYHGKGWFARGGAWSVSPLTITNLQHRRLAIRFVPDRARGGRAELTDTGRKLIAAIDPTTKGVIT